MPQNSNISSRPRIGITMGDAAGIGPEIVLKALAERQLITHCQPIVIGDAETLRKTARAFDLPFDYLIVKNADEISHDFDGAIIYDLQNVPDDILIGADAAETGRASAENIEKAVELWRSGTIDAISTAPISKKAIHLGGYDFPGHTEFLAHLTGTEKFAMSFFADSLCVVLLSIHVSLLDAINRVKKEKLVETILFTDQTLSRLLKRKVKIAVAGLNPHASEDGMFGDEEAREIAPAIRECREKYEVNVSGAYSPDTIFLRGHRGEFDAVVACYHDQATIAVKCLSFGASVNVTLGLPLVRTSVDHGTAYDIAGRGIAEASSMRTAINLAAKFASNS